MDYTVWWRQYWGAMRDPEHGRNSLSALEHVVDDGPRQRLCRVSMRSLIARGVKG